MNHELLTVIRESYLKAIMEGDSSAAQKAVDQALNGGIIPTKIYLDVLMPAQVHVGLEWSEGRVTIPQEHVATQITLGQMSRLRAM